MAPVGADSAREMQPEGAADAAAPRRTPRWLIPALAVLVAVIWGGSCTPGRNTSFTRVSLIRCARSGSKFTTVMPARASKRPV